MKPTPANFSSLNLALNESYERELRQNPLQIRIWLAYIDSLKSTSGSASKAGSASSDLTSTSQIRSARFLLYERALKHVPRSYKVWKKYLNERLSTIN